MMSQDDTHRDDSGFPEKSKRDEAMEGMGLFRMMSSSGETNGMKTLMESFNRFHVR